MLIGMPGIEKRLAHYPQHILAQQWSQPGFHEPRGDFTDTGAIAAIIRILHLFSVYLIGQTFSSIPGALPSLGSEPP